MRRRRRSDVPPFNPMDPAFWRSRENRETPPDDGVRRASGARYPSRRDIEHYLGEGDAGALRLRHAKPIVLGASGALEVLHSNAAVSVPRLRRNGHALVVGPSGTGKSTTFTLPALRQDAA